MGWRERNGPSLQASCCRKLAYMGVQMYARKILFHEREPINLKCGKQTINFIDGDQSEIPLFPSNGERRRERRLTGESVSLPTQAALARTLWGLSSLEEPKVQLVSGRIHLSRLATTTRPPSPPHTPDRSRRPPPPKKLSCFQTRPCPTEWRSGQGISGPWRRGQGRKRNRNRNLILSSDPE